MTGVRSFEDRSDRLLGRERDLDALQDRVRFRGMTAVVARPQMGKSWLRFGSPTLKTSAAGRSSRTRTSGSSDFLGAKNSSQSWKNRFRSSKWKPPSIRQNGCSAIASRCRSLKRTIAFSGDLPRRDALLDELRALAVRYPDDAFVQEVWRRAAGKD